MALTKEQAKARSILDVAHSLGMEMKRISSQEYYWTQHDSLKINVRKNRFSWYSRDIHGDVIDLVRTIKNLNYKEAMHFLETGDFPEFVLDTTPKAPFEYLLGPYEESFVSAYDYLREQRGLSDETISFFGQQGGLAQARYRHEDGHIEPVLVFKYFDQDRRIVGASLQGILPDQERHEGKGYLKKILYNSDGLAGLSVDVGQPNRLVFAEAPIDLMSYYELNKDRLENVRLVAMEGLKEQTISRYFMELYAQLQGSDNYRPDLAKVGTALETAAATTTIFKDPDFDNFITLAIDNDEAGLGFIEKMTQKGIKVVADLPPLEQEGQKMDWNDYLKLGKGLHDRDLIDKIQENKKSLEKTQGVTAETILGDLPGTQEAAPLPEAKTSQPLNDLSPNQTRSQQQGNAGDLHRSPDSLGEGSPGAASKPVEQIAQPDFPVITPLKFSTRGEHMSTIKQGYHVISSSELSRLNKFAPGLQSTAQWYLNELADSKISYFYKDGDSLGRLQVEFSPENFAHLAGISPKGVEMKQVVHDFAQGKGAYGNIQVSNAIKDKSMVLPLLPDILSSQAFVFDDLSTVEKFHRIDLSQAVKTEDEDLLLAIRDLDGIGVPASLMKFKEKLAVDLIGKDKIILGVYRERDGQVTQLSVNDAYIKDGGREMMAIMAANLQAEQAKRYDVIQEEYQLDSDGDGISNADEIRLGTDPHNANSRPGREEESKVEKIDVATVSELIAANDTKGLSQHLREGMRSYLDSDRYKEFLTAMSKFHNYSPQNIALILAQKPEATVVASYQKWQKDFKRQVQKGEKGLKIRVPMTFTLKDENGQPKLDEKGQEIIVTRFKLGTVFDVSQTKGEDLPRSIYNLEGDVIDYENLYRASRYVSEQNGVPVTFEKIDLPNANGFHDPINSRIVLADKQMSEAQIMKTLFHEMAHSDLHKKSPEGLSRTEYATNELQAESVAYVVASHYGIDTSEYSFAYLTSWAKTGDSFERFEEQLKVVQEEAKSLITRIDQALELIKRKELTQDKFQSKLSQAQAKQTSLLLTKEGQAEETKKSQDMSNNLS